MAKVQLRRARREGFLSRAQIIQASIEILDSSGEAGLTFRSLSDRLVSGPGAIYRHVENKNDLLTAACDAIVVRMLESCVVGETPKQLIHSVALSLFHMMDEHPWVGSALLRAEVHSPTVRILERVGQQVRALGIPSEQEWATVAALMNYMLGVGAQNAANGHHARTRGLNRAEFLHSVATVWLQLDGKDYPFVKSVAEFLPIHDDRVDFISGIELILNGALRRSKFSTRNVDNHHCEGTIR